MTGIGPYFQEQQRERVRCPDFEVELVVVLLDAHGQTYHVKERPSQGMAPLTKPGPRLYRVSLPRSTRSIGCPVGECEERATTCTNICIHFIHHHMRDTVMIMEEGNRPHPRCPYCDMSVPWAAINRRQPATSLYAQGTESNRRSLAEDESRAGAVTGFRSYDSPLETVSSFKYLGRLLTATDDNRLAVISNLREARKIWYRLDRIFGKEGAYTWTLGHFYVTVFQAIPLFGSETWVVTPPHSAALGGGGGSTVGWQGGSFGRFHNGRQRGRGSTPFLRDVMREGGNEEIEVYISKRQNTVAQYMSTRPILYLCLDTGRRLVSRAPKQ